MIPANICTEFPNIMDWSILLGYRGSIAHGMYIPGSDPNSIDDKDVMGIVIPPRDYYYGLKRFGSRGTQEIFRDEWDIVLYELTKAIRLLEKGNPNMLQLLWLKYNHYLRITPAGRLLLENRDLFVGKHVYKNFIGYAYGQLKRMTHCTGKGYMGARRKALVEKYGYDTKNASHLIRLLRVGIEFLITGKMRVFRHDSQELLEIKRGEWTQDQVITEANRLFGVAEETMRRSVLPDRPDYQKIDDLCLAVADSWMEYKRPRGDF